MLRQAIRRPLNRSQYVKLIVDLAGGTSPDEDTMAEVLESRTIEEIKADTATYLERVRLARELAERPRELLANEPQLRKDHARAKDQAARLRAKIAPLWAQLGQAEREENAAAAELRQIETDVSGVVQSAHGALRRTASLAIDERMREKQNASSAIARDLEQKRQELASHETKKKQLEKAEGRLRSLAGVTSADALQDRAGLSAETVALRSAVKLGRNLAAEVAELQAQFAKVEEEKYAMADLYLVPEEFRLHGESHEAQSFGRPRG